MKTIEIYEQKDTVELQSLLKKFEIDLEDVDLLIDKSKIKCENYDNLQHLSNDLDIDVHLIRMELNKRLWEDK
jgi:hypothetical protein